MTFHPSYAIFASKIPNITLNMENKTLKRLPVGLQTFCEVIGNNCLYIDKTEYILKIMDVCKCLIALTVWHEPQDRFAKRHCMHDDLDGMLRLLQAYMLTIPYC